jgi:phosphoribosylanthranilate isomerase
MIQVKICGLRRMEEVQLVNRYRPDFAGFVMAPGRRQVSLAEAAVLAGGLAAGIGAAGVFVDADLDTVCKAVRLVGLTVVQLHGSEEDPYIGQLRRHLSGICFWKAFRIRGASDVAAASSTCADLPLLDTWSPQAHGGTGRCFDWRLLDGFPRPFVLAGGLDADNVTAAMALHPACLDLSSSIETDGRKDEARIRAFMARVREHADLAGQKMGGIDHP